MMGTLMLGAYALSGCGAPGDADSSSTARTIEHLNVETRTGGRIFYSVAGIGIFEVDATGTLEPWFRFGGIITDMEISASGSMLAFSDELTGVYVVDFDRASISNPYHSSVDDLVFSPDYSEVYFRSNEVISIIDLRAGEIATLHSGLSHGRYSEVDRYMTQSSVKVTDSIASAYTDFDDVVSSPEGNIIAFMGKRDRYGLWIANADGSSARQVWFGLRDMYDTFAFSPDGKQIAISHDETLTVVNLDNGSSRKVAEVVGGARKILWV